MEFLLKNCKTGQQGREKLPQTAQQKSPTALKRLDISIKRTLKIGHRLCQFCAIQQRKEPVTSFMSQALGAPEGTRTPDLLIRSQTLYPAELPARNVYYNTIRSAKCQAFFQKSFHFFKLGGKAKFGAVCLQFGGKRDKFITTTMPIFDRICRRCKIAAALARERIFYHDQYRTV